VRLARVVLEPVLRLQFPAIIHFWQGSISEHGILKASAALKPYRFALRVSRVPGAVAYSILHVPSDGTLEGAD
jgi:hypothetical protein